MSKTRSDPDFFRRLADQQHPNYLWIGCSDSRVPANEIVGLDPGELFVHRNVANVVHTSDMNILSVLEFAVGTLGVEHIIVCGHYGCGGVRRALSGDTGSLVDHWLAPIVDLQQRRQDLLGPITDDNIRVNTLCELNVEMQVRRVAATPIVQSAWVDGKALTVHGWIYGLRDGLLRNLDVSASSIADMRSLTLSDGGGSHGAAHAADAPLERAWLNAVRRLSDKAPAACNANCTHEPPVE
ncbi:MAG: carbonic anhydrase [Hyphomicrobiaceae bacterium]|nr:carbonic anhydrase [Hyphomicrobiaceae bacterium]